MAVQPADCSAAVLREISSCELDRQGTKNAQESEHLELSFVCLQLDRSASISSRRESSKRVTPTVPLVSVTDNALPLAISGADV